MNDTGTRPTYETYDQALAVQERQLRTYGIFSGIIHVGDRWALRYDIVGGR